MVESHEAPVGGVVAIAAGLTERASVMVLLQVAGDTIGRGRAIRRPVHVACRTTGIGVRSEQRKIGKAVIKALRVEHHDLCVSAFMIGMAI